MIGPYEIFYFTLQEFGNILLAISYLPTAQRLTINLMKVRDVKYTPTVSKDFSMRRASLTLIFLRRSSLLVAFRFLRQSTDAQWQNRAANEKEEDEIRHRELAAGI